MKRNRKNSIKRERTIMIASSAFVLTALTLTGIYMKEGAAGAKDNGYTVDFSALETKQKEYEEFVQNEVLEAPAVNEDELDYMPLTEDFPMEAGSALVEIPGLTDENGVALSEEFLNEEEELSGEATDGAESEDSNAEEADTEKSTVAETVVVSKELSFSESDGLARPVSGEVLLPYSMEAGIYFATLDQYKYNPATIFAAGEGDLVLACADGKVIKIFENEEIGHAVTLELGNGYQVTYGQLEDIQVTLNGYINKGETLASVAAPTKYFSADGTNLYFALEKDGTPVNPENLF